MSCVADVVDGSIQVGYVTVLGMRRTGIYASATIISHQHGEYQIRVEHVPGSCGVRVSVLDLSTAREYVLKLEEELSMPRIVLREDKLAWAHALVDGSIVEVVD